MMDGTTEVVLRSRMPVEEEIPEEVGRRPSYHHVFCLLRIYPSGLVLRDSYCTSPDAVIIKPVNVLFIDGMTMFTA